MAVAKMTWLDGFTSGAATDDSSLPRCADLLLFSFDSEYVPPPPPPYENSRAWEDDNKDVWHVGAAHWEWFRQQHSNVFVMVGLLMFRGAIDSLVLLVLR